MHTLFTSLCFGAVLALPLIATAATPAADDPVAASFARMLDHTPVTSAPSAPTGRRDKDPLHTHLTVVLWERQPSLCGFAGIDVATVERHTAVH